MAGNAALPNASPSVTRRHGAHDSALENEEHKDYGAAQRRIDELEEENGLLAEKATAASQRFADYENELRVLRETLRQHQQKHQRYDSTSSSKSDGPPRSAPSLPQPERPGLGRFGSFMRMASGAFPVSSDATFEQRQQELEASLIKEQTARIVAEAKVKEVISEIEELSASLFQQANEMVAVERRENSELREKIKSLEAGSSHHEAMKRENESLQKAVDVLKQRDIDRQRRLENLEAAQKRIDRVRMLVIR